MTRQFEVIHYTENGKDIFEEYTSSLRDKLARFVIDRAVDKTRKGNFGKNHYCRDGVWELIINASAGYRVYYSIIGSTVVLLLCAGSKRTQRRSLRGSVD